MITIANFSTMSYLTSLYALYETDSSGHLAFLDENDMNPAEFQVNFRDRKSSNLDPLAPKVESCVPSNVLTG